MNAHLNTSKKNKILCVNRCARYWRGFHIFVWTQYHIFAISKNVETSKVILCCSSEKHQPNLIIWSRLGYFVASKFLFSERVCRYIYTCKMEGCSNKE